MNYSVLLGDVVRSRDIKNREIFQSRLEFACKKVAQKYRPDFQAEMKIIKGADEIGAVLNSWENAFDIMSEIMDEIHPYHIRFSLVSDRIDVGQETRDAAKMDGRAFHVASALINELKPTGLLFGMQTGHSLMDLSLSNQVCSLFLLRQQWSPKQYEIIGAYREEWKQTQIAARMNITQQEVSRLLLQIHWKQFFIMEDRTRFQFRELGKGRP